jgi:hypothetical protein
MTTNLYPFAQSATEREINDRFSAAALKVRYGSGATRKQVDYLVALCLRNDESRRLYQWLVCETSGELSVKRASSMIDKLLKI